MDNLMESSQGEEAQDLAQLANATSIEGANDELISMASSFVESAMMVHNIPCDFDGLSLNVLRDPDTHKLLAVVITPVDVIDDKPEPRYDAHPSRVTAAKPKIVLAG